MAVPAYAQTNLQLYRQLEDAGRSGRDLVLASRAYELAVPLFSAQFRASGKPFLCHLVGTASILAAHGADAEVVAGGLLHASYAQGNWGDTKKGATPERRQRLVRGVGVVVEDLVERYTALAWNADTIPQLLGRSDTCGGMERTVVTMRLANLLEDYLDRGMDISGKGATAKQSEALVDDCVRLAERLGLAGIGGDLEAAVAEHRAAEVPPALVRTDRGSTTVAPLSHSTRPALAASAAGLRLSRGLRRRIQSRRSEETRSRSPLAPQ